MLNFLKKSLEMLIESLQIIFNELLENFQRKSLDKLLNDFLKEFQIAFRRKILEISSRISVEISEEIAEQTS